MNQILTFLTDLVKKSKPLFFAKSEILSHKTPNDVLSEADLRLNDYFSKAIKDNYPDARIIAEESENNDLDDELTFVIDPLDGTCNYSLGLPLCGIQIAVFQNKECFLSLIFLPYFEELYVAEKGKGAYLNDKKLSINKDIKHSDGILELSDFYTVNDDICMENQFKLIELLQPYFLKTRLFGAACIDFSYLATNKAQAYICYYRHIWDIAPGLLIALEAGACFSRINEKNYEYGNHSIILANNEETLGHILKTAKQYL